MKESTRYGRLSPHSAEIEVGAHPRRPVGRPLEASNGTLGAPERPPRALSFTGQPAAAELRPRMATLLCATPFTFRALTLNSPCCPMQPHGAAMTQRPSHTPLTDPATLGDGCPRLAGSGYGPPRCSLISSAQIRRGCCPPPARMTPAASDHCNPPRQRGSNLLPLLSGFGQRTVPPYSTSWAPAGAAAHSFARCLQRPRQQHRPR